MMILCKNAATTRHILPSKSGDLRIKIHFLHGECFAYAG
jgi:hypothetical protein